MFISKHIVKINKNPIILDGSQINCSSNHIKFLGLYIDENLTWKLHISRIREKNLTVRWHSFKIKAPSSNKILKTNLF